MDNKFSTLETAIDWKEAVNTFADLATAYPKPDNRVDGDAAKIPIIRTGGAARNGSLPKCDPQGNAGCGWLAGKEDKAKYDDTYSKRHTHSNKSVIDKITQSLLDAWSAAYTI